MKIHILFQFMEGPYGGANQFLKSLRVYFREKDIYTDNISNANVVIVNCSPMSLLDLSWKIIFCAGIQKKFIVARIDGPVFKIRGRDLFFDKYFFVFCRLMSDLIIFQSNWSKNKCVEYGLDLNGINHSVVINSPDKRIFFPVEQKTNNNKKQSIVISSWSANSRKGFDVYRYLDEKLDFKNFDIVFFGNSPVKFKNIKMVDALGSEFLARELRRHDYILTASEDDPCSNALLEGIASGLFPIALRSGGHPEIVGARGILFDDKYDLLDKLSDLAEYPRSKTQVELSNANELYYSEICKNFSKKKRKRPFLFFCYTIYVKFISEFTSLVRRFLG